MTDTAVPHGQRGPTRSKALAILVIIAFVGVVGTWLSLTPAGLLGKADGIGYAICHRIDGRSFHIHDRQLPMCSRDTGIFLGAIVGYGVVVASGRARHVKHPSNGKIILLASFIVIMGIDGVNSYSHFFEGLPHLYEPRNWLRMVTGTFHGLALSSLAYPLISSTLWRNPVREATIKTYTELGGMVLICALIIVLVLFEIPLILYPVALLSAAGVVMMLTSINTAMVVMLFRRENTFTRWRDLSIPILMGTIVTFAELGGIALARFALTGTWGGFDL